jgi:predicted DNA-binding transcriptional regulator YafY
MRLLSVLSVLQARGTMTGQELAWSLEVSERTVQRDVAALAAAGIPIVSERGRAGGYRLPGGYRLHLSGLTGEEAEALPLTGLPAAASELGLASIVATAELKVLAALPRGLRQRAERAKSLLHVDAPGWYQRAEATPRLPALAAAVWQDRRLDARYRRSDGKVVSRVLNPLGLVLKGGAWYLVADAHRGRRVFRVSRFERASLRAQTFPRPRSFDLASFWAEWSTSFEDRVEQVEVALRVRRDHLRYLRNAVSPSGQVAFDTLAAGGNSEWVTLVAPFDGAGYAQAQLLGFGPAVEVLGPREFLERLAAAVRETAALYEAKPDGQ